MHNKLRSKAVLIAAEGKPACLIPEENQPLSSLILRQLICFTYAFSGALRGAGRRRGRWGDYVS